jgi:hypothetical protein
VGGWFGEKDKVILSANGRSSGVKFNDELLLISSHAMPNTHTNMNIKRLIIKGRFCSIKCHTRISVNPFK